MRRRTCSESAEHFTIQEFLRSINPRLAVATFGFSAVPLLFRTLRAATLLDGRTVYAWSNPDLSVACFLTQLFNFIILSTLLATIWTQWSSFASGQQSMLSEHEHQRETVSFQPISHLSHQLLRFQAVFLTISVGFALYTGIFWTQIVRNGDARFWLEAIVAHGLWLITIVVIAIPLIQTWRAVKDHKLRVLTALVNEPEPVPDQFEAKIASIRDLGTFSNWNLVLSGATIIVTVAVPFIQAFIK